MKVKIKEIKVETNERIQLIDITNQVEEIRKRKRNKKWIVLNFFPSFNNSHNYK
jgi:thiamine phosphate synthase YjbQ (UPF0047 family)